MTTLSDPGRPRSPRPAAAPKRGAPAHAEYMRWGAFLFVLGWVLGMTFQLQLSELLYTSQGAGRACEACHWCDALR